MTTRANFWVMKFSSLVAFEQLKSPNAVGPWASIAAWKPAAARSKASSQVAGRRAPVRRSPSRTKEWRPPEWRDLSGAPDLR